MDQKNPFGYDQVDNAWAAKNLIVNHQFPLIGMAAKGNSGIFLGPVYYYLITFFYWILNLNPIASGIFAGVTSIFTFWVLYYFTKRLFNTEIAIIAVIINTFNINGIIFDRVQWNAAFIPSVSLIIFYLLYKVLLGDVRKIPFLAIAIGLFFSIHFTAIFFPLIIILSLPFFPKTRDSLKYILLSLPLFLVWLVPNLIYQFGQKSANFALTHYLAENYHGFHLTRVIQLTGDALIQFDHYAFSDKLLFLKFIALPLFFLLFLYRSIDRKKMVFCYLILLWFVVPWFAFATYKGELTDYYFSINRFIVLFIVSYFVYRVWNIKIKRLPTLLSRILIVALFAYTIAGNLTQFISYKDSNGLADKEKAVLQRIKNGEVIKFQQGVPESYIYYYLTKQKGKNVR
jgi:4-amino-4-deoxy-L-arabinose transferase-like glycosyltransferase